MADGPPSRFTSTPAPTFVLFPLRALLRTVTLLLSRTWTFGLFSTLVTSTAAAIAAATNPPAPAPAPAPAATASSSVSLSSYIFVMRYSTCLESRGSAPSTTMQRLRSEVVAFECEHFVTRDQKRSNNRRDLSC